MSNLDDIIGSNHASSVDTGHHTAVVGWGLFVARSS